MPDFVKLIEAERERLNKLISELSAKRDGIDQELDAARIELSAIAAYENARAPKVKATRKPKSTSKRSELTALIKQNPNLSRGELIDKLGIKGDTGKEQSLSNALAALKKAGIISASDGKYTAL